MADRILAMLESLGDITDGFATDQLTHCLQTATLAERAGAEPEVVFASLCHDIGKAVSVPNHPAIAAEIIRPYVSDDDLPHDPGPTRTSRVATTTPTSAATPTPASSTAASPGSTWPPTSPTTGTRSRSIPTTTRCPSSHFEPLVREMTASARIVPAA